MARDIQRRASNVIVMVMAALAAGCSLTMSGPSDTISRHRAPSCSGDFIRPVIDSAVAAPSLVVAAANVSGSLEPCDGLGCMGNAMRSAVAAINLALGLVYGASAIRGWIVRARCRSARREHRQLLARRVGVPPARTTPAERADRRKRCRILASSLAKAGPTVRARVLQAMHVAGCPGAPPH